MLSELKLLLSKHEDVDEEALKGAASALLSRQFLYRAKRRQRKHFETVARFQPYFYNLMAAVGHQLLVEEERVVGQCSWRSKVRLGNDAVQGVSGHGANHAGWDDVVG